MGEVIDLKKKLKRKIKVIDPRPVWVGISFTPSGKEVRRYMTAKGAEKWFKEKPTREVRLYLGEKEI